MNNNNSVTTLCSVLCTSDISPECEDLNGIEYNIMRKIAMLLKNNNSDFFNIFIPIRVASLEVCVSQNREK